METLECIKTRRSVRKFKTDSVSKETIEKLVLAASYAPSWKNTQTTRYIAITNEEVKARLATECCAEHNAQIINGAPLLIATLIVDKRSGFERDGSFSTSRKDAWQAFEEKLQSLPLTNKNSRQFARFFLAGAASCEVDKQGRILLPQVLREFAGLEKEVVMVGVANRVEIWSKERWQECIDSYDDDMDEVAENMESLGFSI